MSEFETDLFVIGAGSGGVRAARIAAGSRREGRHRRGVPRRRHLRHSRLRAQEALCLRRRFRRRRRRCRGFGWTYRKAALRLARRSSPPRRRRFTRLSGIYEQSRQGRRRAHPRRRGRRRPQSRASDSSATPAIQRAISSSRPAARRCSSRRSRHSNTPSPRTRSSTCPTFPRLLIVGGGYIAVEFACVFTRLGTEVTLAVSRRQRAARLRRRCASGSPRRSARGRHHQARRAADARSTRPRVASRVTLTDGGARGGPDLIATGRQPHTPGPRARNGRRRARASGASWSMRSPLECAPRSTLSAT